MEHEEKEALCQPSPHIPEEVVTGSSERIRTILIAGQIEGHTAVSPPVKATKYELLLPRLVETEEDDSIDGLLVLINTVGGDVEAGLAMAEMIAGMKKPTVSLVLGGGHSIGIPLAVAAKESFMVKSATMTVHPVRIQGLVLGVPQSFEYLRRMQERISAFILEHSRIAPEVLEGYMSAHHDMATDIGTILSGREAARSGLVDHIGTFREAMDALKQQIRQKKAP
jgi:ATP-dependent protease ClpP protease subunit